MSKLDRIGTKDDLLEHIGLKQGRDRWFYGNKLNLLTAEVNKFVDELVAEGKIYEHPASGGCYLKRAPETTTAPASMTGVTVTKLGPVEPVKAKSEKAEPVKVEEEAKPEPVKSKDVIKSVVDGTLRHPEIDPTLTSHAQDIQRVLYYLQNRPGEEASAMAKFYGRKVSEFSQVFRALIGSKTIVRVNGKMFIRGTEPSAHTVELSHKNRYNMRRRIFNILSQSDHPLTQAEISESLAETGDVLSPQVLKNLLDVQVSLGNLTKVGQTYSNVMQKADVKPKPEPENAHVDEHLTVQNLSEHPVTVSGDIHIKAVPNPLWIHTLELLGKAHEGLVQHICFEIIEHLKRPK